MTVMVLVKAIANAHPGFRNKNKLCKKKKNVCFKENGKVLKIVKVEVALIIFKKISD